MVDSLIAQVLPVLTKYTGLSTIKWTVEIKSLTAPCLVPESMSRIFIIHYCAHLGTCLSLMLSIDIMISLR